MELSIFLAKVFGLYLIIVPAAALVNRRYLPRIMEECSRSLGLVFLSGIYTLILGLLVVVSHNLWTSDWRVIITILGWLNLAKGVFRILLPQRISQAACISTKPWWGIVCLIFIALGAYLLYESCSAQGTA